MMDYLYLIRPALDHNGIAVILIYITEHVAVYCETIVLGWILTCRSSEEEWYSPSWQIFK